MIGIFDSGIGGLSVLEACQGALPDEGFLYYGDHANAPYGEKSAEEIHELTRKAVRQLFDQGCDLVILACNTASAVALHDLQTNWLPAQDEGKGRRVLGVFVPIIEAMTLRDWGDNAPPTHTGLRDVLLFATPATIASGAFARELKFRARDVEVHSVACDGLVALIEAGERAEVEKLVGHYVRKGLMTLPNPQTAALACTHYPLAKPEFAKFLPSETTIFCQPSITAQSLVDYLKRHPRFHGAKTPTRYLTSGNPAKVSSEASAFIGHKIKFEGLH